MAANDYIVLEDVRLLFRNFSGKADKYNREGDRNFSVALNPVLAERMAADGFNVKLLPPLEDGMEPQAYLKVTAKYRNLQGDEIQPPNVVLITARGRTNLGEEQVGILDWADIVNVDLTIRPFSWAMSDGKSGVSAYLRSIFVTINEDPLEAKYAELPQQ